MNRFVTVVAAAVLALAPFIAHAQTTAPTYQGADGQTKEAQGTFCVGTGCATSGGATRTTAAGTSDTQAVPVQGVTGGVPVATAASQLPASLGPKTGANSLSMVPGTDAIFILGAGTSIAGRFGIDQTTPGNTNGVSLVTGGLCNAAGCYVVPAATSNTAAGITPVPSTAVEGGHILKASSGNLYGLNVVTGATAGVVQLINATTIPADGAVAPVKCYVIAANTSIDLNYRSMPLFFSTGIVAVFSSGTSCFTKAASATAFISGDAK